MTGYAIHTRSRFRNPLWENEPYCPGYAWDWLVAHAAWKDTTHCVKGNVIDVRRGQLCVTVRGLEREWNWSKSRVSRFLNRLKSEKMIEKTSGTTKSVITICNYEKYQAQVSSSGTDMGQDWDKDGTLKKKDKKIKNISSSEDIRASAPSQPVWTPLLEYVSEEVAKDFAEHRKAKRSPLKAGAVKGVCGSLSKIQAYGHDPEEALKLAMEQGWNTIRLKWMQNAATPPRGAPGRRPDYSEQFLNRVSGDPGGSTIVPLDRFKLEG